ncbi:MAG TPA: S41 family peptidase, partial [Chitinophagaceae bacterium]|nr:S41 family peptidase [Chitinophagaceae bacterium]
MRLLIYSFVIAVLSACSAGRSSFNPNKKYSPAEIQKDYSVFQNILQQSHPGLYWYTTKDSLDYYFKWGVAQLKDSMTEPEFRKVLSYVAAKIHCGHTSVRFSDRYSRFEDTARGNFFPLSVKIWNDTMVVAANLNRRDSIIKRGTMIKKINNMPIDFIVDSLFQFLSADGYNQTHKYQTLSNRGFFGSLFTLVFGPSEKYSLEYADSLGQTKTKIIPANNPRTDTFNRRFIRPIPRFPKLTRRERKKLQLPDIRSLRIDSSGRTGFMELNSFGRGFHLKKFFRSSFRSLRKTKVEDLVIDVRGNGGGNVTNSTFISRYLTDHHFKIADSLY